MNEENEIHVVNDMMQNFSMEIGKRKEKPNCFIAFSAFIQC